MKDHYTNPAPVDRFGGYRRRDTAPYVEAVMAETYDGRAPETPDFADNEQALESFCGDAIRNRLSPVGMIRRAYEIQAGLLTLASFSPTGRGKNRAVRVRFVKPTECTLTKQAWEILREELRAPSRQRIFAAFPWPNPADRPYAYAPWAEAVADPIAAMDEPKADQPKAKPGRFPRVSDAKGDQILGGIFEPVFVDRAES